MQRDLRKKVLRELETLAAQAKDPERTGLLLAAHNALVTLETDLDRNER